LVTTYKVSVSVIGSYGEQKKKNSSSSSKRQRGHSSLDKIRIAFYINQMDSRGKCCRATWAANYSSSNVWVVVICVGRKAVKAVRKK
jgi:hypothetical protein